MKTAFYGNLIKTGAVFFILCLAVCVQPARAITLDQAVLPSALAGTADDLVLPGTPLPDYGFSQVDTLSGWNLSPSDVDSFLLGLKDGTFLVTGNTYFNFTGDLQTVIIGLNGFKPASPGEVQDSFATPAAAPEPASLWLCLGALVLSCIIGGRIRQARQIQT